MNSSVLIQVAIFFAISVTVCWSQPARSHHLLERHEIYCDSTFPCPPELVPRVEFWADIFHKFSSKDLVLHDTEEPYRVYALIRSDKPCTRSSEPKAVRDERRRIRHLLDEIARKVETKEPISGGEEFHVWSMFGDAKPEEIRAAKDGIRCQAGIRERFDQALGRYEEFASVIQTMLKDANLPEDLQFLPFVESSYDPMAYSRVGAAGIWQIMPRTARKMGLKISGTVDERFDPERATQAAILYFKEAYESLAREAEKQGATADQPLSPFVITSYNYGVAGMRKALRQVGPDFIRVLKEYEGRRFRTAVKNFYASFLAARHVTMNSKEYFGRHLKPRTPVYVSFNTPRPISVITLSSELGLELLDLRQLNPSLTQRVWRGRLPVPKGFEIRLPQREKPWGPQIAALGQAPEFAGPSGEETHKVERGESVWTIAKLYGVTTRDIIDANDLDRRGRIRAGEVLVIPGKAIPALAMATKPAPKEKATPKAIPVPEKNEQAPATDIDTKTSFRDVAEAFGVSEQYLVQKQGKGKKRKYFILTEADESLSLYAEWMGLATDVSIRSANDLEEDSEVTIGTKIYLPVSSGQGPKDFELKRIEYHKTIEDEFLQRYDVIGQEIIIVQKNESLEDIMEEHKVPLWLLRRFNPKQALEPLAAGITLITPVIQEKSDQEPDGQ